MDVAYKIYLVEKFLNHSLTAEEEKEFRQWLDEDVRNRNLIERLQKNEGIRERMDYFRQVDEAKGWAGIKRQCDFRKEKRFFLKNVIRYAAMIAVIAGAYWLLHGRTSQDVEVVDAGNVGVALEDDERRVIVELAGGERLVLGDSLDLKQGEFEGGNFAEAKDGLKFNAQSAEKQNDKMNRIVVPRGGEYQIVLSDGTKVWLNADTYLIFPSVFDKHERIVEVKGEAFFEVAHNAEWPFVVKMDKSMVKVLGTSFNINTYDQRNTTTLVEGVVELALEQGNCRLKPGEQGIVENGKVSVASVNVREYISWKDGFFIFRNRRLEDALTILSRWYDLQVYYQNEQVKELHFTGNIRKHADVGQLLRYWEETGLVGFEIKGKTVRVFEK